LTREDTVKEKHIIAVLNPAARITASDIVIAHKQATNAEKKLAMSSLNDLFAGRSIVGTSTERAGNEIVPVY
jgi:membrane protein involved in colicin uptake